MARTVEWNARAYAEVTQLDRTAYYFWQPSLPHSAHHNVSLGAVSPPKSDERYASPAILGVEGRESCKQVFLAYFRGASYLE